MFSGVPGRVLLQGCLRAARSGSFTREKKPVTILRMPAYIVRMIDRIRSMHGWRISFGIGREYTKTNGFFPGSGIDNRAVAAYRCDKTAA